MNKSKLLQTANELANMGSDFAEAGLYIKACLAKEIEKAETPAPVLGESVDADKVDVDSDENSETKSDEAKATKKKQITKHI